MILGEQLRVKVTSRTLQWLSEHHVEKANCYKSEQITLAAEGCMKQEVDQEAGEVLKQGEIASGPGRAAAAVIATDRPLLLLLLNSRTNNRGLLSGCRMSEMHSTSDRSSRHLIDLYHQPLCLLPSALSPQPSHAVC